MSWITEALIVPLVSIIEYLIVVLISFVITPLSSNFNTELFDVYFGDISNFLTIIAGVGIFIAVGIFVFQMFKVFFYKTASSETDSPAMLFIMLIIAIALILSASNIRTFAFNIAKAPFSFSGMENITTYGDEESEKVSQSFSNLNNKVLESSDSSFDTHKNLVGNINGVSDNGSGLVAAVITLALVLPLGIAYLTFLLKIVMRFVLIFVGLILSPLAFATVVSRSTAMIMKKYLELIASSMVLFFIDMIFLKLLINGLDIAFSSEAISADINPILSACVLLGLANVAAIIDQTIGNLVTTITGTKRFGSETILMAKHAMRDMKNIRYKAADIVGKKDKETAKAIRHPFSYSGRLVYQDAKSTIYNISYGNNKIGKIQQAAINNYFNKNKDNFTDEKMSKEIGSVLKHNVIHSNVDEQGNIEGQIQSKKGNISDFSITRDKPKDKAYIQLDKNQYFQTENPGIAENVMNNLYNAQEISDSINQNGDIQFDTTNFNLNDGEQISGASTIDEGEKGISVYTNQGNSFELQPQTTGDITDNSIPVIENGNVRMYYQIKD